jgi:hypothetical protein
MTEVEFLKILRASYSGSTIASQAINEGSIPFARFKIPAKFYAGPSYKRGFDSLRPLQNAREILCETKL